MSGPRVVQPCGFGSVGLLLGWLIPERADLDQKLRAALPNWGIVVTDQAPLSVTSNDLIVMRRLARASSDLPVAGFAWSAGCQSLRAAIVSKVVQFWGVAAFDGTHANVPPADWQIQVWADLMDRAREGLGPFVGTATQMTYTKDFKPGEKGRAFPTSCVLARALGLTDGALELDKPVTEAGLFVGLYPSDEGPTKRSHDAHMAQILDVAPNLLASYFAQGPTRVQEVTPKDDPAWKDPELSHAERLALWAEAEAQDGVKEDRGPNDSDRIREYFALPYKRRATGQDLSNLRGQAWCAAAASFGLVTTSRAGEDYPTIRVSGLEFQQDAIANHTWTKEPKRGDLVIMSRPGAAWYRHVGIVTKVEGDSFAYLAGNEADTWGGRTLAISSPEVLGFVPVP